MQTRGHIIAPAVGTAPTFRAKRWISLSALLFAVFPGCGEGSNEQRGTDPGGTGGIGSSLGTGGRLARWRQPGAVDAGRTLELSQCGTSLTGPIPIPQITAWGEMATTTAGPVHLSAGLQVIRVTVGASDYLDLDSITFDEAESGAGGAGGSGGMGTGGAGGAATGGAGGGPTGKFVGNITTGWNSSVDTNGLTFSTYWDQITPGTITAVSATAARLTWLMDLGRGQLSVETIPLTPAEGAAP